MSEITIRSLGTPSGCFFNDDSPHLRKSIINGRISFPSPSWANITDEAIDFISKLLKVSPSERMTAVQALDHPWFKLPADAMSSLPDQASQAQFDLGPREVLSKFLTKRPPKEQLEQAHILISHSPNISSRLAAKQHAYLMAERKDQLQHYLKNRPPRPRQVLCI